MDPNTTVEILREGNRRFAEGSLLHPRQTIERRLEVLAGQKPVAAVLCCSDSRVPPEIIFDQGLGDLFVIRNAGHVIDEDVMGSLEYAVEHLNVSLIVVLGHEKCGAVTASVHAVESSERHAGFVGQVLEKIAPAVKASAGFEGDPIENAAFAHVKRTVKGIQTAPSLLTGKIQSGQLQIRAAYYHLESGMVDFLTVE